MAEQKKNYCDKDGQCTADSNKEMRGCRFNTQENPAYSGVCSMLRGLGCFCMHPEALVAKLNESQAEKKEYIADIIQRAG